MRKLAISGAVAALVLGGAMPAIAHPHVFVDAGVDVVFDGQGQAVAVRIRWTYDDLYSLMIIEENGHDADGDGALTADELAKLQGFDMQWAADFQGDTYVLLGADPLALAAPTESTASYEDGRLTSTHLRRLAAPVTLGAAPLVVQVYDPSFYTSYQIAFNPMLTDAPQGCSVQVFEPDRAKADATLEAALAEYAGTDAAEGDFPAVGAAYAEEARVTCAGA